MKLKTEYRQFKKQSTIDKKVIRLFLHMKTAIDTMKDNDDGSTDNNLYHDYK